MGLTARCLRPHSCFALALVLLCADASAQNMKLASAGSLALPDRLQASAAVLAPNDAVIAAEIAAVVSTVHVDAGRSVAKDQELVSLDARDARLALAQADAQQLAAQARLTLADQRARRGRELRAEKHISEDELLALETGLDAARAELALAGATRDAAVRQLDKCRIRAPFAGVVLERQAQVGALAVPGAPLLRLVSTAAPEVEAQVTPDFADELDGARDIEFEAGGARHALRLVALSPVLERTARTRLARFEFVDTHAPAGSTGTVSWLGSRLLLPAELMVKRDGQLGAFVADDGRARFVHAPDAEEGRPFLLRVEPDTQIVSRGQQGVNEGDPLPTSSQ